VVDDGLIGKPADPLERDPPVGHLVGQVADGGGLGPAQSARGQELIGGREDGGRGDLPAQGLDEPAMDGGRRPPGQLLEDDHLGQRLEPAVGPGRATRRGVAVAVDQAGQDGIDRREVRGGLAHGRSGHTPMMPSATPTRSMAPASHQPRNPSTVRIP
jgi:hypothetical protein